MCRLEFLRIWKITQIEKIIRTIKDSVLVSCFCVSFVDEEGKLESYLDLRSRKEERAKMN